MNLKEEVEIAWAEHRLAFHLHALSRRPATPSIPLGRLPTQERKSHTADTSDAGQLRALQKQLEISGYENGALKADVQSLQAELPSASWYLPASQAVQKAAPVTE